MDRGRYGREIRTACPYLRDIVVNEQDNAHVVVSLEVVIRGEIHPH